MLEWLWQNLISLQRHTWRFLKNVWVTCWRSDLTNYPQTYKDCSWWQELYWKIHLSPGWNSPPWGISDPQFPGLAIASSSSFLVLNKLLDGPLGFGAMLRVDLQKAHLAKSSDDFRLLVETERKGSKFKHKQLADGIIHLPRNPSSFSNALSFILRTSASEENKGVDLSSPKSDGWFIRLKMVREMICPPSNKKRNIFKPPFIIIWQVAQAFLSKWSYL